MTCKYLESVQALVAGKLAAPAAQDVKLHMAGCEACEGLFFRAVGQRLFQRIPEAPGPPISEQPPLPPVSQTEDLLLLVPAMEPVAAAGLSVRRKPRRRRAAAAATPDYLGAAWAHGRGKPLWRNQEPVRTGACLGRKTLMQKLAGAPGAAGLDGLSAELEWLKAFPGECGPGPNHWWFRVQIRADGPRGDGGGAARLEGFENAWIRIDRKTPRGRSTKLETRLNLAAPGRLESSWRSLELRDPDEPAAYRITILDRVAPGSLSSACAVELRPPTVAVPIIAQRGAIFIRDHRSGHYELATAIGRPEWRGEEHFYRVGDGCTGWVIRWNRGLRQAGRVAALLARLEAECLGNA